MERLANITDETTKAKIMEHLNEQQALDMQQLFNDTAQRCFNRCVNNFRTRELDSTEKRCIDTCCKKFMSHYQRVGIRFADENAQQAAGMQQQQQQ